MDRRAGAAAERPRQNLILLLTADAVEWPVSVVPTGDREVHELTLNAEGLILRGPSVPVQYDSRARGPCVRR